MAKNTSETVAPATKEIVLLNSEAVTVDMKTATKTASLIKKVSIKSVFGDIKKSVERIPGDETNPVKTPIMRMVGTVIGFKTGTSDYGDWIGFKGDFVAVNLQDGKAFRGGQAFLPEVASNLVQAAIMDTDDDISITVAFDIFVQRADNPTGFEYTAKPLMPVAESDPMMLLLASVETHLALPEA